MHEAQIHYPQVSGWEKALTEIREQGFAHIQAVLPTSTCDEIAGYYTNDSLFRKTIDMARYRFGKGQYKYLKYPLPPVVQSLRASLYEKLAPAANNWANALHLGVAFPPSHVEFIENCGSKGQLRPTPLLLTYREGDYNTLHQDLYGDIYFPFQAVFFLKHPGNDYAGGEFLMVEQRPRAQSRGYCLTPEKGDLIIFATNQRPVAGSRGYYRVQMRHGVSTVHWGHRMTLGIPFHDAL